MRSRQYWLVPERAARISAKAWTSAGVASRTRNLLSKPARLLVRIADADVIKSESRSSACIDCEGGAGGGHPIAHATSRIGCGRKRTDRCRRVRRGKV